MSDSNSSRLFLRSSGTRRGHQVAMIELGTKLSAVRRAKIAFWAVGSTVGVCTAVVASAITSWPRAIVAGVLTGFLVGLVVGVGLFCWPALRVAWHWAAEILALTTGLVSYLVLTRWVPWWAALALLVVAVGVPFAVPASRRWVLAWVLCVVSRQRLRVCFAAFVASQQSGRTPLILLARPIPAGERVWIWLRPGLALADLEQRLDRLATGCWATECRIAPASTRYAALLRVDITRRNPLVGLVGSPLPGLVPATDSADSPVSPALVPVGLDLSDTPPTSTVPATGKRRLKAVTTVADIPEPVLDDILPPNGRGVTDLSDWI